MIVANVKGIVIQMDAENKIEVLKVLKAINEAIIGLDGEPQIMAKSLELGIDYEEVEE